MLAIGIVGSDVSEGVLERPKLAIGTTACTDTEEDDEALDNGIRFVDGVEEAEEAEERG